MLKLTHRWVGLLLCLSIFIISLSGVLLLWKKEYLWLSFEQARQDQVEDSALQARSIENIIRHYQKNEVRSIQLNSEGLSLHKVFLTEKRYAWHDSSGNKLEVWKGNERIEDFLLDLHHRFLLGNTIGLNIAGFSGLLLLPLMLVGLWLWWPRRKVMRFGLLPKKLDRSALMRRHSNLGATAILPIFALAISGVILVYPDQSRQVLLTPFVTKSDYEQQIDRLSGKQYAHWQSVLERVNNLYPLSKVRWVSPPSEDYPNMIVGVQQHSAWNTTGQTAVYFDSKSGIMDGNANALLNSTLERVYNFSYPLHTGKLGLWYRLIMSLFGAILCAMTVFGFISYLKR